MSKTQEDVLKLIKEKAEEISKRFVEIAAKELEDQGHVLTGALQKMEIDTKIKLSSVVSEILMEEYFDRINDGRPSGTYTDVRKLTTYFQRRGLQGNEAPRAAFATSRKHYLEGMPTRASYRFSRNGRRTGFIDQSILKIDPVINEIFGTFAEGLLKILDGYVFKAKIYI